MGDGASGPSGSTDAEGRTSPGARERAARGRTRGTFRVFYPEYGSVEAVLGLVVLYLVVDVATPVLVESLAEPLPDLVPEPLTTLTAASLWVLSALVVFAAALDQWRVNPREFGSREDRDRFLDANRLEEWRYYANGGLVLAGAAVAVVSWDTFRAVLEPVLVTVVEVDAASLSGTPIADVVVFVAFFVGVSAVTRGIDRVVVGSLREFAYRRHRRHR